jgi:hypothetical protein
MAAPPSLDVPRLRLASQQLAGPGLGDPAAVVVGLVAVQAQDYLGALWAVGVRLRRAVEADVERALAERTIVRTWPMRGTLHFVAAADVRWLLALLTPRVVARNAARLERDFGLREADYGKAREVLTRALEGGRELTRGALYETLEAAGIASVGQRGLHIVWRLAQEGLLCFAARRGKQQTFVLLDEWIPESRRLEREEALGELARRYFAGHGPATGQDFAWWSGLAAADARTALELAAPRLASETVDGRTYWLDPSSPAPSPGGMPPVILLPAFDEYAVAYKDRRDVLAPEDGRRVASGNGIFYPTIVAGGRIVGTWKRGLAKRSVTITPNLFRPLQVTERQALARAAERYGAFLGLPAVLEETS